MLRITNIKRNRKSRLPTLTISGIDCMNVYEILCSSLKLLTSFKSRVTRKALITVRAIV